MTVPSLLVALPFVLAVTVLWFWLMLKLFRWIVGPIDARIVALARRIQEADHE